MRVRRAALLQSAAALVLLQGCAAVETRPGHPLSYQDSAYYNTAELWSADKTKSSEKASTHVGPEPLFASYKVPREIWTARGYAWNKHVQYDAAGHKAQDVADGMAIPLWGAAIAAGATAAFHAGADAIAGAGLGAAGVGGVVSYAHPDKDAATDFTTEQGLLCVVDQTTILRNMSAVPLIYEEAALQDVLNQLEQDAGPLLRTPAANAQTQALQKAVNDIIDSGASAIKQLQATIAAYNGLPGAIYQAVDKIDLSAKSTARSLDFSAMTQAIQASATNAAGTQQTKDKTAAASGEIPKTKPPTALQAKQTPASVLAAKTAPEGGLAAMAVSATDANKSDQQKAADAKATTLSAILSDKQINSMTKVIQLSNIALADLPSPSFSDIAGNVAKCATSTN